MVANDEQSARLNLAAVGGQEAVNGVGVKALAYPDNFEKRQEIIEKGADVSQSTPILNQRDAFDNDIIGCDDLQAFCEQLLSMKQSKVMPFVRSDNERKKRCSSVNCTIIRVMRACKSDITFSNPLSLCGVLYHFPNESRPKLRQNR